MEQATAIEDLNGYLLDNRAHETEVRFGALAELFDQNTFRHLDALGVGHGWRCWEVGAGGPTVANWLAERVGPSGYVVATDIDLSWLPEVEPVRFDARRLDVAVDDPPAEGLDRCTPGWCSSTFANATRRCAGWPPRCVPVVGS